jgi:dipeptidyl aminopeptidase/acylaminoacyl peptidase
MRKIGLAGVLLALAASAQTARRGVTAEDYLAFEQAGDPQISPDGKSVAYTVTTINPKTNRRVTRIWTIAETGAPEARPFTEEGASSSSPRWSPDGKALAFLSAGPGGAAGSKTQIWVMARTGGAARQASKLENGASSFEWSPDGTRFVCLTRTGPPASKTSDVKHYTRANYKFNDTGWFDGKRSHVAVVDAATGEAKQITNGDDWNDLDPHWSPDGTKIAFVSNRTGKEFDFDHNSDVWTIPAGGGALTKISDHAGPDRSPRWSPDGKWIAFLGSVDEEDAPIVYLAPAGGGASRAVSKGFDQMVADLQWGDGGKALYFTSGVKSRTNIYRIDAASGKVEQMSQWNGNVHALSMAPNGAMVHLANDFEHLDDVYVPRLEDGKATQLTHLNKELWGQLEMAHVERVPYKGEDGLDIEGFLVKPVGWQPGKKYPMVLSIHGGPAGMYGVDWFHEFQVYAGYGWAVFFCNPRGSTGYGNKFQRAVAGEWGGKAYTDIMRGVDEALRQNPWIDAERLGVTGGSYGGFMTNWIVTQTNRFKAAVTLRSIANFVSDDGTRDGAYGHARDFGGDIFQNFDAYWKYSPVRYAGKVKTPTLVLHSENDFRVPFEQGEQWFRALQHYGVTSEFVLFPRENHNLTRTGEPKHLVESLKWQVYWFERFLDGKADARRPTE